MLTKETFLFFLQNGQGQSYYRKSNGVIDYVNAPTWLKEAPDGWFQQELAFGRNSRYWGLNRSYTQSFTFYNDSADILRYLFYKKKGIEEPVYLVVLKLDDTTDIYQPYYKGEVDLSHIEDDVVAGVKVNVIEGGLQKLIKAYENTVFEIPCDGSIAENVEILIKGVLYQAVFNYTILPLTNRDDSFYIPLVFDSKQGNDIGIVTNGAKYLGFVKENLFHTDDSLGVYKCTNNIFSSVKPITGFEFSGSIGLTGTGTNGHLFIATSLGNSYDLIPITSSLGAGTYNFDITFNLAAGENAFFCYASDGGTITLSDTRISIKFNSQFDDTTTWGLRPYDLLNLLVKKIASAASLPGFPLQYEVKSDLLNQYKNLVLTCGMALRQEAGAVIKTSLSDFFTSFDAVLSAAMGVESVTTGLGERLFFESLRYVLDTTNTTMDLGEVAELKISPALDLFFDVAKFGYPEQKYDEQQGNQEYNTTSQYRTSVKRVQKEFKKVSIYRGDSTGIEYTRFLIGGTNSSNNRSDNDVFILNTDFTTTTNSSVQIGISGNQTLKGNGNTIPLIQYSTKTGSSFAGNLFLGTTYSPGDTIQYVNSSPANVGLDVSIGGVYNGQLKQAVHGLFGIVTATYQYPVVQAYFQVVINNTVAYQEIQTLYDGHQFQFHYNTQSLHLAFGDSIYVNITPVDPTQPFVMSLFEVFINYAKWSISETAGPAVYGLKKQLYNSFSGVDNVQIGTTSYAYNIEDMTPARIFARWASYVKSVLASLPGDTLTFQTSDKNKTLVTSIDGINYITEQANIPLGSITSDYLFYPFYLTFKTQVPINFSDLLSGAANGHISFTFNGVTFYGFPMQVKQKPALNEAQEWKLLCSPLTNIDDLVDLEYTGIDNIQLMNYGTAISKLCPVKFVPMGYVQPSQYNFIHMDQDWFINRVAFWPFKENYFQKWQTNDTINIQCITNGLAPVVVQVYNDSGNVFDTFNLNAITDAAVNSPLTLWQGSYSLASVPEGYYYLVLTAGTGGTTTSFISEGLWVKALHSNTLLFEYTNGRNRQATIFTSGYAPSFRVEGWLENFDSESKFTTFEDQPANIVLINGIPYELFDLNIGDGSGIPDYIRRLLERIMLLSNVKIDGQYFTRNGEAKFEKTDIPGWPNKSWKLRIRDKFNSDAITLTTSGDLDSNLTIEYQINTKNFGDGAGTDNIVQVETINN